jgi:hypothetical protein
MAGFPQNGVEWILTFTNHFPSKPEGEEIAIQHMILRAGYPPGDYRKK